MTTMMLSLSLLFPVFLGWVCLKNIFRKSSMPWPLVLAVSYGLGTGFLAQMMFLTGVLGIPYALPFVVFFPAVVSFYLLYRGHGKNRSLSLAPAAVPLRSFVGRPLSLLMSLFVVFQVFYVFWTALNIPVFTFDAISSNVFKAKIIFQECSLEYLKSSPHPTYPLHTELLQVWTAVFLDRWDDRFAKIFFPFNYLAFLTIVYYFVARSAGHRWAGGAVVLLTVSNFFNYHATIAYRDFTLMFYNCSAAVFLMCWDREKKNAWLWTAGLYAGFMTFVKLEGAVYAGIHLTVLFVLMMSRRELSFKKKMIPWSRMAAPCLAIGGFFAAYSYFAVVHASRIDAGGANNFDFYHISMGWSPQTGRRLFLILREFWRNLFLTGNWNFVWPLLFLSGLNAGRFSREARILGGYLLLFFGTFTAGYALTQYYIWLTNPGMPLVSRQVLQVFPLAVLLIVVLNAETRRIL